MKKLRKGNYQEQAALVAITVISQVFAFLNVWSPNLTMEEFAQIAMSSVIHALAPHSTSVSVVLMILQTPHQKIMIIQLPGANSVEMAESHLLLKMNNAMMDRILQQEEMVVVQLVKQKIFGHALIPSKIA